MRTIIYLLFLCLISVSQCSTCITPGELVLFFDGNTSPNTDAILQTLKKHNTTATFFVNSTILLQANTQNLYQFRKVKDSGHTLGLSFNLSPREMSQETDALRGSIENIVRMFQEAFGVIPRLAKAPADASDSFNSFLDGCGFVRPKISIDISQVWNENCPAVFNSFMVQKSGDSIILNLADSPYTCAVPYLKDILESAAKNSYSLQNIVDCLNLPGPYRQIRNDGPKSYNLFDTHGRTVSSVQPSQFGQAQTSDAMGIRPYFWTLLMLSLFYYFAYV